jgi:hypothetical protein
MLGLLSNWRWATLVLMLTAALQPSASAQSTTGQDQVKQQPGPPELLQGGPSQGDQIERIASAVAKWLASDQTSEALMAETVAEILKQPKTGMHWLGERLPAALAAPNESNSKGIRSLVPQVILEFLRQTHHSEMVYVGQYAALSELQPVAADFLFTLLIETPDWYPFTFRERLVPALRDIQLRLPTADRVDGIVALIKNPQETTGLRNALAAMMAQWGRAEYADAVVKQLIQATAEGDGEDRVQATLNLADYYNLLRDYKNAARAHRTAQALAKGADVPLLPVAFYAAACVHALNGDLERGMDALMQCARLQASPDLDRSRRVERKLFDKDPEIALLRSDARFAEALKLAFGDAADDKNGRDGELKDGR